jgi:hypothetical protein
MLIGRYGKLPVIDVFAASEAQFNAMRLPKVATVEVTRAN